jgi:hypothetical protein
MPPLSIIFPLIQKATTSSAMFFPLRKFSIRGNTPNLTQGVDIQEPMSKMGETTNPFQSENTVDDLSNQRTFRDMDDDGNWPEPKKVFLVPAHWEMYGIARIEAKTIEEAILIAENESRLSDFNADYVMESFSVDTDVVEEKNNNG